MDVPAFQACLEDKLPWNPVVNDEEAIGKCVEDLTSCNREVTAALAPQRRTRVPPRPRLPPEEPVDEALPNHDRRHFESPDQSPREVGNLLTGGVERCVEILGHRGQGAIENKK
jgi:hypothetical protein